MFDLDQPEIADTAARAASAPDFTYLVRRARRRRRRAVVGAGLTAAAVVTAAAAVAGSTPSGQSPVAPPATHQITKPATSSPPTTPPAGPTQPTSTVPSSGACPAGRLPQLPPHSGCASLLRADFDGDGADDLFVVYRNPIDVPDSPWYALLVPRHGPRQVLELSGDNGFTHMRAVASTDVNQDGADDAIIVTSEGASASFLGIVTDVDDRLTLTAEVGGKPFDIGFGSVVLSGTGATCRSVSGHPVVVQTGYAEYGGHWHFFTRAYRWQGGAVVAGELRKGLTTAGAAPSYAEFHCFGVDWTQIVPPVRAR